MTLDLGGLADDIAKKQVAISKIMLAAATKAKPFTDDIKVLEEQLQLAMMDSGVVKIEGKVGVAEIKTAIRVGFADWEEFITFAKKHNALHLFPRSIGVVAYRELKELRKGKPIPGLSEYEQTSLNVKTKKA